MLNVHVSDQIRFEGIYITRLVPGDLEYCMSRRGSILKLPLAWGGQQPHLDVLPTKDLVFQPHCGPLRIPPRHSPG